MSDNPFADAPPGTDLERAASPHADPGANSVGVLRRAVSEVMDVRDITLADGQQPTRFRGRLQVPSERAFGILRPQFEAHGFTPRMVRDGGDDVILAIEGVFRHEARGIPWTNLILLVATILSVLYVGVQGELFVPVFVVLSHAFSGALPAGLDPGLMPTPAELREALFTGGMYTLALLGILGAHEMGHYIVARRYKVEVTPPYFIPLPINILGTLGAVIAMREPAPNRRIQFDIGIAGPIAGLVVAVPVMIVGLMLSTVGTPESFIQTLPEAARDGVVFFQEGQSLLYMALKYLVFGQVLPSGNLDVWVHPVAFAAWAGFLVTALNLLPIGQLDGGHVMYGLFGRAAQKARLPIIAVLVVLALAGTLTDRGIVNLPFGWSGWWLWAAMAFFLLRNHAPVLDEITELDPRRKALGLAMLVVFVLIFTPRPIVINTGFIGLLGGL